ncbi:hypothetical protein AB0J90_27160 [Micromonospora sp. NPDC049523]|uniref:hypothetical protein n=1 Tax=Micromonospora sp. NPDC049523 TaxID=3155921 RepID=UPI00343E32E3
MSWRRLCRALVAALICVTTVVVAPTPARADALEWHWYPSTGNAGECIDFQVGGTAGQPDAPVPATFSWTTATDPVCSPRVAFDRTTLWVTRWLPDFWGGGLVPHEGPVIPLDLPGESFYVIDYAASDDTGHWYPRTTGILVVGHDGDGDYVPDSRDECAAVPGALTNAGCPDETPGADLDAAVDGSTVHLRATNPVNGADRFDWTVTRADDPAEIATVTGADVRVDNLAPGEYEARVSVCRTTGELACVLQIIPFTITAALAFTVQRVANAPLSRRFVVTDPQPGVTYRWSVDGTPIGNGNQRRFDAPATGTYGVTLSAVVDDRPRSVTATVTVGYRVEVDNSLGNGLLTGAVADPAATCDPHATVLTVTSGAGVWAELRTSASAKLLAAPQPGATAALGLLPPGGVATWTGGCFDNLPQSFQVRADIATDRALAATALAGFLSTISGGTIDLNSLTRAMTIWEGATEWPLPQSRAAVAEFGLVLRGRGSTEVALGHIWEALTQEPEATQLRQFVFATGGAIPGLGDLTSLAEAATGAWLGLGASPYQLGRRVTVEQLGHKQQDVADRLPEAEQAVTDADTERAAKQAAADAIQTDITSTEGAITAKELELARTVCSPALPAEHPCFRKRARLQSEITRLGTVLDRLENTALPPALARLGSARQRLDDAEKAVTALRTAGRNLAAAASFLSQLVAVIELSARVYSGNRSGSTTFRTGDQ